MRKSPLKRRSSNDYSVLMKNAVETFNRWIRNRDAKRLNGICYTCRNPGSEAGHFRHNNNATKFNEIFVNLQCTQCNRYQSGNLGIYAIRLIKEYGQEKVDELIKLSHTTVRFNKTELRAIIEKYKI